MVGQDLEKMLCHINSKDLLNGFILLSQAVKCEKCGVSYVWLFLSRHYVGGVDHQSTAGGIL